MFQKGFQRFTESSSRVLGVFHEKSISSVSRDNFRSLTPVVPRMYPEVIAAKNKKSCQTDKIILHMKLVFKTA